MTDVQALKEAELVLELKAMHAKRQDAADYWREAKRAIQTLRIRLERETDR